MCIVKALEAKFAGLKMQVRRIGPDDVQHAWPPREITAYNPLTNMVYQHFNTYYNKLFYLVPPTNQS